MKFSELKDAYKKAINSWNVIDGINFNNYVPMKTKYGIVPQVFDNVIKVENGYATIDRMIYEIELYHLFVALYTDVEFNEFTDEDCDFLIKNNFKSFLQKQTNNDSFLFESIYKNLILDQIRKLNSNPQLDFDGLKDAIDKLNNLDPDVKEALSALNPDKLTAIRKVVDDERNNHQ